MKTFVMVLTLFPQVVLGLSILSKEQRKKSDKVKTNLSAPIRLNGHERNSEVLKLKREKEKLQALLRLKEKTALPDVDFGNSKLNLRYGARIGGVLGNTIETMNIESPVEIIPDDLAGFPPGTIIHCSASRLEKRINLNCFLLDTPAREIEINAVALDTDGSIGLRGYYWTPDSEILAASIASGGVNALLDSQKDSVEGLIGTYSERSFNNSAITMGKGVVGGTSEVLVNNAQKEQAKVYIEKGTRVIVFFQNRRTKV